MIPFVTVGKLITTILTAAISFYTYKALKKNKENYSLDCFFKFSAFFLFACFCFLFFPFIKNLQIIQLIFYLVQISSFISIGYAILMILAFMNLLKFKKIIPSVFLIFGAITILFSGNPFKEAAIYTYNFMNLNFIGWMPNFPLGVTIVTTLLILFSTLFCWLAILIQGIKNPDFYIRKKTIVFSAGVLLLGIGSITYFSPESLIQFFFYRDFIHIIGIIFGVIFLFSSHFYKKETF